MGRLLGLLFLCGSLLWVSAQAAPSLILAFAPNSGISDLEALSAQGIQRIALFHVQAPERVLILHEQAPQQVIPLYAPSPDPYGWQFQAELVETTRQAIQQHPYRGIWLPLLGEFAPRWRENPVLRGILALGGAYDLPLLLWMDLPQPESMLSLCRGNPGNRFLFMNPSLDPAQVAGLLRSCPKLWIGLTGPSCAGEMPHYLDDQGKLSSDWADLMIRYPQRFLVGASPWASGELAALSQFHRRWAQALPPSVAAALMGENAKAFFAPRFPAPAQQAAQPEEQLSEQMTIIPAEAQRRAGIH